MKTSMSLARACREYEEDLVLHYYGDSGEDERRKIELHLTGCGSCRLFLDDLQRLLPQITRAETMPQSFWDSYYRETVSKLQTHDEQKSWWRSIFTPLQTWMVPAFSTLAVALLVIGLMFGKSNLISLVEPHSDKIPQEILADKNQLEFFESLDIIEVLSKLEAQDEPKTEMNNRDANRASLGGQIA
jgi:putative zinc finger protein